MVYTKATFELAANILRNANEFVEKRPDADAAGVILVITTTFKDAFVKSNPRFDIDRFLKACGYRR